MVSNVRALLLRKRNNKIQAAIETFPESLLPKGDCIVQVTYSTLNYKDGLILKSSGGIVRSYPHVPGIDLAGIIERSATILYQPGDVVILTGWRLGEWYWGGYTTKACVQSRWLTPMPSSLDARRAMALGTAGFTAMLAIMSLEEHMVIPETGEILVTGATGGVGSIATIILSRLGYRVVASTRHPAMYNYLYSIGARRCINQAEFSAQKLRTEQWAGVIDTVGGNTLATLAACARHGAVIAVCGNVSGNSVSLSVIPILLRGVKLLGVASVLVPPLQRRIIWERITNLVPLDMLDSITSIISLSSLTTLSDAILQGNIQGRVVVNTHT